MPTEIATGIGPKGSVESDLDFVRAHRTIWAARPELRAVYHEFFEQLLGAAGGRTPVVEFGAGPGFFKEYFPNLISTDVLASPWVDIVCDGCAMPFRTASVGAIVMLDVLHHLPRPVDFLIEAARVLVPGGVVVMIEPWITPASYLLYRYLHHEDCTLKVDIARPFEPEQKKAFDGNASIPYNLVRRYRSSTDSPMRLTRLEPFLGLPYLSTFGFKRTRPMAPQWRMAARRLERALGAVGRWNATRALLVWEKAA